MVWRGSGGEGPCIKFLVQILPALAKAEHSEIHTLESQVQKEGSLKKKKNLPCHYPNVFFAHGTQLDFSVLQRKDRDVSRGGLGH